jgi:hypothetical protein
MVTNIQESMQHILGCNAIESINIKFLNTVLGKCDYEIIFLPLHISMYVIELYKN